MRIIPCLVLLLSLMITTTSCDSEGSTDKSIATLKDTEIVEEAPGMKVNLGQVILRFDEISDSRALGAIQTSLHNVSQENIKFHFAYSLSDSQGSTQRFKTHEQELEAGEQLSKTKIIEVQNPIKWSPDNPEAYQMTVRVIVDGAQEYSQEIQSSIRLLENTAIAFNGQGSDISCMPQTNPVVP